MYNVQAKQDKTYKQSGTLPKRGLGHQPHRSGAGAHKHATDRRNGTRSGVVRKLLREW